MRRPSLEHLATTTAEGWAAWFREALIAFHQSEGTEEQITAFLPLAIDPRSSVPGEVARQIRQIVRERIPVPAKGCAQVVESWSLQEDGWQDKGWRDVSMAIEIGAKLNAPGLFASCERLLDQARLQPSTVFQPAAWLDSSPSRTRRERLTWSCLLAAENRFTAAQIARLGQAIARGGRWTPLLVAEFGGLIGPGALGDYPRIILDAALRVVAEQEAGRYVAILARRLHRDHPRDALRRAFAQTDTDDEESARLRGSLRAELGLSEPEPVLTGIEDALDESDDWIPNIKLQEFEDLGIESFASFQETGQ